MFYAVSTKKPLQVVEKFNYFRLIIYSATLKPKGLNLNPEGVSSSHRIRKKLRTASIKVQKLLS